MKMKLKKVTYYINPNDPDGQRLVMIGGPSNAENLKCAAEHFGCSPNRIETRSEMASEQFISELPEYEG